jgi:hypothetical protein
MTSKEGCGNCRFFARANAVAGWCRRFPPTVVGADAEPRHPWVIQGQWCGEWKEKTDDE